MNSKENIWDARLGKWKCKLDLGPLSAHSGLNRKTIRRYCTCAEIGASKMPHLLNAGFSDTVARRLDTGHSSAYLSQQCQTSRNLWNPVITILIADIHIHAVPFSLVSYTAGSTPPHKS